jgi:hypothetical protein
MQETGFAVSHLGAVNMGSMPESMQIVVHAAQVMGADPDECEARLNAYQYLVVAGVAS